MEYSWNTHYLYLVDCRLLSRLRMLHLPSPRVLKGREPLPHPKNLKNLSLSSMCWLTDVYVFTGTLHAIYLHCLLFCSHFYVATNQVSEKYHLQILMFVLCSYIRCLSSGSSNFSSVFHCLYTHQAPLVRSSREGVLLEELAHFFNQPSHAVLHLQSQSVAS